jgi:hypothetical protein
MATTPECLQKRFQMPVELGTMAAPRVWHGISGARKTDRRDFLMTAFTMLASGAIGAEGQHRGSVRGIREGVTQDEMAKYAGCRRETVTRRMRSVAAPANGWRRQAHLKYVANRRHALTMLEIHKETCPDCLTSTDCTERTALEHKAATAGARVKDTLEQYEPRRGDNALLIGRRRRFGMASIYSTTTASYKSEPIERPAIFDQDGHQIKWFFDPDKAEASCEKLNRLSIERGSRTTYSVGSIEVERLRTAYPTAEELGARMQQWFDQNFHKHGFKQISRWIWDPRLLGPDGRTLGTIARLVMSAYESMGLLEELRDEKTGKVTSPKGWLQVHQEKVAQYLGIDKSTLHRANQQWEDLGVLRIVSGKPKKTETGVRRGPMIVLYMPMRRLTDDEARAERERIAKRTREIVAREGAWRLQAVVEAQRLADELLTSWTGCEHCLGAFWREWARQMLAAAIDESLIRQLIPAAKPPNLEEEPDWFDSRA